MDKTAFTHRKYDDLTFIKELGQGRMGTVYLATFADVTSTGAVGGEKVVVKVGRVLPRMMKPGGQAYRELEFYRTFASRHRKQLRLYLLDYMVADPANVPFANKFNGKVYQHPVKDTTDLPPQQRKLHEQLIKARHCLVQVLPYLEGKPLTHYFDVWMKAGLKVSDQSRRQYSGWFADILKQVRLLHSTSRMLHSWGGEEGHTHGDIHPGNVMVLADGTATLIDYGNVDREDPAVDLLGLYHMTHLMNHFDELRRVGLASRANYMANLKEFGRTLEAQQMAALCSQVPAAHRKHVAFDLAEMLLPELMKSIIGGRRADELRFKQVWLIDLEDVLLFLNCAFAGDLDTVIARLAPARGRRT